MMENMENMEKPLDETERDLENREDTAEPNVQEATSSQECEKTSRKKPFRVSLGVFLTCILLVGLLVFQTTSVLLTLSHKEELNKAYGRFANFEKLIEVAELYDEYFLYDVDLESLDEMLSRMYVMSSGDQYSSYYTKEEWQESRASSMGNSVGIGVYVVATKDEKIEVAYVMKDTPASRAGMQKGDIIVAVDGTRVSEVGYTAAVDMVRGEIGKIVTLDLIRNGSEITVEITRGNYSTETVISEMFVSEGKQIGYVRIVNFAQVTPTQFKDAMNDLIRDGATGFVFDVRDNPGGDLEAICKILDYLLPEGPIVHIMPVDGKNKTISSDKNEIDLPMVVLANSNTASAAELFTSALKDYEKAVVVGTKTYGKGCGQSGYFTSDGSVVFITNFFYKPPFSDNYDRIGILPDETIEMPEHLKDQNLFLINHDEDVQLAEALRILTLK